MKNCLTIAGLAVAILSLGCLRTTAAERPSLPHKLTVTPEIKRAFQGSDSIEIRDVTGTAPKFQVGGTYRVVGVCRQEAFKSVMLYIGNTAEAGSAAIAALEGSSLFKNCPNGVTEFDVTFTLLRPGILHATLYDTNKNDRNDNALAGIYLGDVVFRH